MNHPSMHPHTTMTEAAIAAIQAQLQAEGASVISIVYEHARTARQRVDALIVVAGATASAPSQSIYVEADSATESMAKLRNRITDYATADGLVIWATPTARRFAQVATEWIITPRLVGYYDGRFYNRDGSPVGRLGSQP